MVRVLHLSDSAPDYQTESALASLSAGSLREAAFEHRTIGPGGSFGNIPSAVLRLSGALRDADLVHAWGNRALIAAALSGSRRIVFSPSGDANAHAVRWARAAMNYCDVQVICPTDTSRRMHVERGVPLERCHMIRPGVRFADIRSRRDDTLRMKLGISKDDRIILACGESTRAAAHHDALFTIVLLHVMDPRDRLLIWGRGPLAASIRKFADQLARVHSLIDAEHALRRPIDFAELPSVADEILITAKAPVSTLPISIAMASAIPIVATVTPTVAELLQDRHTAMFVTDHRPRLLAERIMRLRDDSNLRWRLTDMARTEAFEYFSGTRFLSQFGALYAQVAAGKAIELPQAPAGAGLRFHGLA